MPDSLNRSVMRAELATALEAALVSDDDTKPLDALFAYQAADFGGKASVMTITSAGIQRAPEVERSGGGWSIRWAYFNLHVFILYANGEDWTEEDSEDRIDLVEKMTADALIAAYGTGNLEIIEYNERSQIAPEQIGPLEYRHEVIPIRISKLLA